MTHPLKSVEKVQQHFQNDYRYHSLRLRPPLAQKSSANAGNEKGLKITGGYPFPGVVIMISNILEYSKSDAASNPGTTAKKCWVTMYFIGR